MLELRALNVWLDGEQVLYDVSVKVERGEICALLGPSGCGKSTLLRTVAGLLQPMSGTVMLAGRDATGVPVEQRGVGLMFQEHALFPHLSVAGNVAFGLRMQRVPTQERDQRVADVLDLVGMAGLASRRVSQLSGGERQRVALARTLAPRPDLMLLDEPLGALDRRLRDHLLDELPEIFAATGTTAVYVTHDHSEAERIASRIAVMSAGRIDRHDTPARLWREPTSVFTAQFLHLGAVWVGASGIGHVVTPFGRLGDDLARGVLLPYEALRVTTDPEPGGLVASAQVVRALFQAGRRYVQVRFTDGQSATVACDDRAVCAGSAVTVVCPHEQVTVLRR